MTAATSATRSTAQAARNPGMSFLRLSSAADGAGAPKYWGPSKAGGPVKDWGPSNGGGPSKDGGPSNDGGADGGGVGAGSGGVNRCVTGMVTCVVVSGSAP